LLRLKHYPPQQTEIICAFLRGLNSKPQELPENSTTSFDEEQPVSQGLKKIADENLYLGERAKEDLMKRILIFLGEQSLDEAISNMNSLLDIRTLLDTLAKKGYETENDSIVNYAQKILSKALELTGENKEKQDSTIRLFFKTLNKHAVIVSDWTNAINSQNYINFIYELIVNSEGELFDLPILDIFLRKEMMKEGFLDSTIPTNYLLEKYLEFYSKKKAEEKLFSDFINTI